MLVQFPSTGKTEEEKKERWYILTFQWEVEGNRRRVPTLSFSTVFTKWWKSYGLKACIAEGYKDLHACSQLPELHWFFTVQRNIDVISWYLMILYFWVSRAWKIQMVKSRTASNKNAYESLCSSFCLEMKACGNIYGIGFTKQRYLRYWLQFFSLFMVE